MGKEKYVKNVLEFFGRTPVASSRDIKLVVNKSKPKKAYPHLLVHNLVKSGRIRKVVKGFYTSHEDPTVAVFCFKPAYIGLQDALSVHDVWEQQSNVVIVTSKKVRAGTRKIMGASVILHRINPKYLFGFDYVKYSGLFVPVSDLEKTFIDFIYFKEHMDKGTLRNLKRKINRKRLRIYLKRYPKRFRDRVKKI